MPFAAPSGPLPYNGSNAVRVFLYSILLQILASNFVRIMHAPLNWYWATQQCTRYCDTLCHSGTVCHSVHESGSVCHSTTCTACPSHTKACSEIHGGTFLRSSPGQSKKPPGWNLSVPVCACGHAGALRSSTGHTARGHETVPWERVEVWQEVRRGVLWPGLVWSSSLQGGQSDEMASCGQFIRAGLALVRVGRSRKARSSQCPTPSPWS